ncbi:PadR family transcriptional regulator [Sanguibacter sp. 25GB23B1]|uniref:PadR family transcriptional regulator n=1 Tax=unclassified Sanguibacter TaxID=2645534 RepID=UPI0032B00CFB
MPRENHTETAVLGALSITPMTGYAVRAAIRETLGHFWSESFGQIYPALARLESDGLVERSDAQRAGSSTFTITPAGLDRLRAALAEPPRATAPRNGHLLRLFFGQHLGPEACAEIVRAAREDAEQQLDAMATARTEAEADPDRRNSPYWLLTISAGEHSARAALAWATEAEATLVALSEETS